MMKGERIMNDKKHNITSKQMMSFIISAQVGFGIITLPSTLAVSVGHDGWISVFFTGIICTFVVYFFMLFLNRYQEKSIFQIKIFLYGKLIGMIINICLFLYFCFATSVVSRLLVELIKITVLKLTPTFAISIMLFIPTVYMVTIGLKVLTRFCSLLFFSYIVAITFYLSIYRHANITFIMPVGLAGIPLISKGMFLSAFSYLGFELVTVIYPYITDKDKAIKYAVLANVFTTFFFTLLVFLLTILAGEEKLKISSFPLFHFATSIKIPIFERADLFFIVLWFPVMGSAVRTYYFSAYHFLDVAFKIKNKKMPIVIFYLCIALLGRIPKDLIQVYDFANKLGVWGIGVISYLIVSFLFSFINKRGVVIK